MECVIEVSGSLPPQEIMHQTIYAKFIENVFAIEVVRGRCLLVRRIETIEPRKQILWHILEVCVLHNEVK